MTGTDLSFEFFPPRTPESVARLEITRARLAAFKPTFFSVTFGAGGSTRELTLETVLGIEAATGIDSAPHISCFGTPLDDLRQVVHRYVEMGIKRVVALRGDMPSGLTGFGALRYASELVRFIRQEVGEAFHIEVAAYPEFHPQASSATADLRHFKEKVDAGANSAITQYFYNPDAYFRFLDSVRALGVEIPIAPGIMPITNYSQLTRFSEMCGAEIPRWIARRLQDYGDDRTAIRAFGIEVTSSLCERLLAQGVPSLHFYAMNQHDAVEAVLTNLGMDSRHGRQLDPASSPSD